MEKLEMDQVERFDSVFFFDYARDTRGEKLVSKGV